MKNISIKQFITILAFLLTSCFLSNCKGENEPERIYKDDEFYSSITNENEYFDYILCLKFESYDSCKNKLTEFEQLNLEEILVYQDDTIRMNDISNWQDFYDADSLDKFLALTLFLNQKQFITKKLYDHMLSACIHADTTNIIANYELSKLRYNEGYIGAADFLIDNLLKYIPNSKEIKRLKSEYIRQFGKGTYDKSMNYREFFFLETYYFD